VKLSKILVLDCFSSGNSRLVLCLLTSFDEIPKGFSRNPFSSDQWIRHLDFANL